MLNSNDEKAKLLPIGSWSFVGLFCSISIATGIIMIGFFKTIIIDNNSISIKHLFQKELKYSFENIVGYKESENFSRTGYYLTFYFKTKDNKTHMFSTNEFSNYSQLSGMIAAKCSPIEIGKFHNLKKVLLIMFASILVTGILIYIKLKSNVS